MDATSSLPALGNKPSASVRQFIELARAEIAAYALVVDAKDAAAVAFYRHHGFIALPDTPRTLFLPLASVPRG